ncbi:hypothetical protein [Phenylobacterium sp.]|uniref:hypothetical protein n=1 Tax=Phenylobacterium sp. TaxID=1871053 RepID=UPI0035B3A449
MPRKISLFLACAVLAGCGQPVSSSEPQKPPAAAAQPAAAAPAPPRTLSADERKAARYVGRWSEATATCATAPWIFTADGLSAPDEVTCDFDSVAEAPGGYDVAAACASKGAPTPAKALSLRFVEAAKGVLVEGGPFPAPVGLIHCEG